jgi:hypothetical protein
MTAGLVYDLMLEVKGILRSVSLRTRLEEELHVGQTFAADGRRWVVVDVAAVDRDDVDRRVVARQVDELEPLTT